MRILLWHVHGGWLSSFVQGGHEYVVPALPDRGPDGVGLPRTVEWPASVTEVSPAELWGQDVDVVVLQRPEELELVRQWLGRRPGVDVPAVYLQRDTPSLSACEQRHPLADQRTIPIVHLTHFNRLFWDNGVAPTTVIEPGVVDPGPRYSGEITAGAVVVNEPLSRGRVVGTDLLPRFAEIGPLDLYGTGTATFVAAAGSPRSLVAHEGVSAQDDMHWELARRRVYLHPMRWTTLGLSLIEAMQIGMPVLALATTAVADAVPADAGVVSHDVDRLLREYRTMLNEPEIARFMGRQARRAALARWSLVRFLDEWDTLLAATVAGGL